MEQDISLMFLQKADKGNSTVVIYWKEYDKKTGIKLTNTVACTEIKKEPLFSLINLVKNFLLKWDFWNVFDGDDSFRDIKLNVKNTVLALVCGLIKIHKKGFPIRFIVSFISSPLYNFDKLPY